MNNLVLIDGNSLLFRAYFAMRPMVTNSGIHTQGIYAFINMLKKIILDYEPSHIAVAFDLKEKTFRHEKYDEYKAGRLKTPDELLEEIPLLHDVLEAMNIKILELNRYEADDLIGTVAKKASKDGYKTLIITGDKDELQLVDENINVLITKKGLSEFDIYDENQMMSRYSLTPKQFIDLKGLMGDKSDNIPGIPGVGEKTGIKLLTEYKTLESVLEHGNEIEGKLGEKIRENNESAKLSKWLATIDTDAPITFDWKEFELVEPNYKELIDVYTKLEFSKFINAIDTTNIQSDKSTANYKDEIERIEKVDFYEFLEKVEAGSDVFIDAITDNSHIAVPKISKIALYSPEKNTFTEKAMTQIELETVISDLIDREYHLSGFELKKIVYSFLFFNEKTLILDYDIAIAEYLLDSNKNKYLFEKLALRHAKFIINDEIGFCEKLFLMSIIKAKQIDLLEENQLTSLFNNCEMPLIITLAEMEYNGITIDETILKEIGNELDGKLNILEQNIYDESKCDFNINSPKQLAEVLFEKMNIPYPKTKGKTTSYSTSADILEKLRFEYDIVEMVLQFRKLSKLKSTYVEGILNLIAFDKKIHPHFQQTVAATGRLSCTEPNLQNIPIRDEYGRLIRKAFITSSPENIFIGSDYSQIELRIMASLSQDPKMIADFNAGKDIHKSTAARVFNIPEDKVTTKDRSKAKAVNFGVIYGMSGFGLSENLKISRKESQEYIEDYFEKHSAVKAYLDSIIEEGEKKLLVKTYFGRIRHIPEFLSRKFMEKELAKRLAMNTPIQGTAADVIKFAMNSVSKELKRLNLKSKLVLQIHDELIVECPADEKEQVMDILKNCMRNAAKFPVDLICDIHYGTSMYELK